MLGGVTSSLPAPRLQYRVSATQPHCEWTYLAQPIAELHLSVRLYLPLPVSWTVPLRTHSAPLTSLHDHPLSEVVAQHLKRRVQQTSVLEVLKHEPGMRGG